MHQMSQGSRPATPGRQSPALAKVLTPSRQSPVTVKSTPPSRQSPAPPNRPTFYRGSGGKPIDVNANYIRLHIDEDDGYGIFEYEVIFQPTIDSRDVRYIIIRQSSDKLGTTKCFDGNKLYVPRRLPDTVTSFGSSQEVEGAPVHVTLKFKRQIVPGDRESIYLYNLCFNKIMSTLKFAQTSRKGNYFDPNAAKDIKVKNLCKCLGFHFGFGFRNYGFS